MDDLEPRPRARRLGTLLRALQRLPEPLHRLVRGKAVTNDRGDLLERDVAMLCRLEGLQRAHTDGQTPRQARRRLIHGIGVVEGPERPVASLHDLTIPGPHGPIRVRVYDPKTEGDRPLLIFLHGGGWVVGDLRSHDRAARRLAVDGDQIVLSVDYGLAPEHPYPEGLDDVLAVIRWAREHEEALGVLPGRIAIGGDSAGGNLSAAACLRLRDAGEPQPEFQLLIYPATDLRQQTDSYHRFGEGFILTHAQMDFYLSLYAAPVEDPRASVFLEPDLAGLAPAIVVTAGFDPLRDEGEAYAARLREAGVAVRELRMPGQIHGFLNMDSLSSASAAVDVITLTCRRTWAAGVR
ncbi:MAG: alpha/beta hydrolase [Myxococcales bacterium]|nr:alpha/beta hydrolase [Myxococcales bacterium]